MNRFEIHGRRSDNCVPRASGDEPAELPEPDFTLECSPRQRG